MTVFNSLNGNGEQFSIKEFQSLLFLLGCFLETINLTLIFLTKSNPVRIRMIQLTTLTLTSIHGERGLKKQFLLLSSSLYMYAWMKSSGALTIYLRYLHDKLVTIFLFQNEKIACVHSYFHLVIIKNDGVFV